MPSNRRFRPPDERAASRPNRLHLGSYDNVGDHDHLPRWIAASLFGAERQHTAEGRDLRDRGRGASNQSDDRRLSRREAEWLAPSLFPGHGDRDIKSAKVTTPAAS